LISCVLNRVSAYPESFAKILEATAADSPDYVDIAIGVSHARALKAFVDYTYHQSETEFLVRYESSGQVKKKCAFHCLVVSGTEVMIERGFIVFIISFLVCFLL
jgi:hypothetical protein